MLTRLSDNLPNFEHHAGFNPAQIGPTSKHKHRCCPCPKWADFVYSLIQD